MKKPRRWYYDWRMWIAGRQEDDRPVENYVFRKILLEAYVICEARSRTRLFRELQYG